MRSVGVEEEMLLVDPATGAASAVAGTVIGRWPGDALERELHQQQLETNTTPCRSLDDLDGQIRRLRREAVAAARNSCVEAVALGTSPLPVRPRATDDDRYQRIHRAFGLTAQEQLTCGTHIHVSVASDAEAVGVLDRIRPWLPVLLALSCNSPYWQGRDSGYASFRYQAWNRWPSAGPTGIFGSPENYHESVARLIGSGVLLDKGMVYFDARLSRSYPTVELRIADVCLDVQDTVLIAAFARALVETAATAWATGHAAPDVGTELLRMATWRASRSGLGGDLVSPEDGRPCSAADAVRLLRNHVAEALAEAEDLGPVDAGLARVLGAGTGADAQRAAFRRTGTLSGVVAHAVERTAAS